MMEKRIAVPEGMLRAAWHALIDAESLIEELRGKKPLANPASMK